MTEVREKLVELVRLAGVRDKGVALRIADCPCYQRRDGAGVQG